MQWLGVLLFFISLPAISQQADPLIFRESIFDFGMVQEEMGHVDHEFTFTNNSGRSIRILSVQASCGCTTPGWTQTPVAAGKTGFVKVSFDPKGRPGYFNKSLTITTDFSANPVILQIKGQVVNKISENELPAADGNLRFKSRSFSFSKVYINKEPQVSEFPVRNDGSAPVKFISVANPSYMKVSTPAVLAPHEAGVIRITYDGKARNVFGFVSDNIQLTTDDSENPVKSFNVFASLEEYYPVPTAEDLLKAPVLQLTESTVDLGRYRSGVTIEKQVWLKNPGKKDLQIKSLQGNCSCITAETSQKTVRPGDSTAVRIIFKPQNRGGTQQKAVTLYSNDPRNPVQRINILAYIED